jgi:uncharacterized protein YjbI with pentapeptide repeats
MSWLAFASIAIVVAAIGFVAAAYWRHWTWTGFTELGSGEEGEAAQPAKRLWDWLQLLLIPLALAAAAFVLNQLQSDREHQREDRQAAAERLREDRRVAAERLGTNERTHEEVLRAYLQQISQLMLDRELLRSAELSEVRAVARTLTLTAVRRLDGERKGLVVRFLLEARLINGDDPKVDLRNADLRYTALQGATIPQQATRLRAIVRRENPRRTSLTNANFSGADLRGADLRRADLRRANFFGADLRKVALSDARLHGADLTYADLRGTDLRRVVGLPAPTSRYAMYDQHTQWPLYARPPSIRVQVTASAIRSSYNGFCPPQANRSPYFKGMIGVSDGPVTVRYQWLSSNGGSADPEIKALRFNGKGVQRAEVYFTQRVWPGDTGGHMVDWIALYVRSPTNTESNHVSYSVTCTTR